MTPEVALGRDLAERLLAALQAAMTHRGHLAQRVGHEGLGYCGWRGCSDRCTAHRALLDELAAAIGGCTPCSRPAPRSRSDP